MTSYLRVKVPEEVEIIIMREELTEWHYERYVKWVRAGRSGQPPVPLKYYVDLWLRRKTTGLG